jgi:hypothetical protein
MYRQRANPYPVSWWAQENILGLTRTEMAMISLWVGIILAYYFGVDLNAAFGKR